MKKKIRAWRRRIIQAESDKPSRSSQHIQADIYFVLPKLFSLCFIFFLFSLNQIIYDCKWLIFMLIKSDYDVFIILWLSLYLFLITPTSSFGSDSRSNVVYLRFFFYFFMMLIIYFTSYVFRFKLFNITYGKGVTTDSYVIALLIFYVYVTFSLLF